MKNIFRCIILITLIFSSCIENNKIKINEKPIEFEKDINNYSKITDDYNIIGEWIICSSSSNNTMIQYNVCPKIEFFSSGKAIVIKSPTKVEKFNWVLNRNILSIKNNSFFPNIFFQNGDYPISFYQTNKGFELNILIDSNSQYFLRKDNN